MATHSSVGAWRIPGTGQPGGLPSVGLHRVGHDWSNLVGGGGESKTGREGIGEVHGEGERKRDRESARACTRKRESQRKPFDSSFYMFFLPPGPALCKLGLARSAVCSA